MDMKVFTNLEKQITAGYLGGMCKRPNYRTSEACVPKHGAESYIFNIAHEDGAIIWENAKAVSP